MVDSKLSRRRPVAVFRIPPRMRRAMAVSPKPRPPLGDPPQASEPPSQASEPDSKADQRSIRTLSGEPVRELYTTEDLPAGIGGADDPIGRPGSYPFTRGIHASMYRGRLWTMQIGRAH